MIEVQGDLWEYGPVDVRCITTNGDVAGDGEKVKRHAVMGRGVARQATQRFPDVAYRLAWLLQKFGNRPMKIMQIGPMGCDGLHKDETPGRCQRDEHRIKPGVWLVSFPVKHHWRDQADLDLILSSALKLRDMADKFGWQRVLIPRPGCGNGGRDWLTEVAPLLHPVLDDRFLVAIPSGAQREQ
jgi:hypothetical protein